MYRLEFDPEQQLVTATLSGFWTPDTVAAYRADLTALLRRVGAPNRRIRLLGRSAALAVQSPETSAAFGKLTVELVELCTGPIAIIAGSTLNKIQASRVVVHERVRVCVDEAEARDWLTAFPAGTPENHQNSEPRFA